MDKAQVMVDQINTGQIKEGDKDFADRLFAFLDKQRKDLVYREGRWQIVPKRPHVLQWLESL